MGRLENSKKIGVVCQIEERTLFFSILLFFCVHFSASESMYTIAISDLPDPFFVHLCICISHVFSFVLIILLLFCYLWSSSFTLSLCALQKTQHLTSAAKDNYSQQTSRHSCI